MKESPAKPIMDYFLLIHKMLESETRNKIRHELITTLRELNEILIFLESGSTEKVSCYSANYDALRGGGTPTVREVIVKLLGKEKFTDIENVFVELKEENESVTMLLSDYLFAKDDPRRWNVVYEKTVIPGVYVASAEQPTEEAEKKVRYSYGLLKIHQ